MTNPSCALIINDLLKNKKWTSALQLSLYEKLVVVAREMTMSPLVVFIPISGEVVLSDLTLYVERVRQMAVDLSTGELTIEQFPDSDSTSNKELSEPMGNSNSDVLGPSTVPISSSSSVPRFQEDLNFDRDECLRLHREVQEQQFDHELKNEANERKKARIEEIRLDLIPENITPDSVTPESGLGTFPDNPSLESFQPDRTIDFYTSVMFAFHDSGTFSYFHAASGLAPPEMCPEDSDDEKPFHVVQQEQQQAEKKRKNVE